VDAVGRIARHVGQVHQEREAEVRQRVLLIADLGGDDALDARRERRVAARDAVVVVVVGALLVGVELVAQEKHGENDVGLLDHLVAVNLERVVVQEEREVAGRGRLQVPHLAVEEAGVLGMDAAPLVVGHVHRVRCPHPLVEL